MIFRLSQKLNTKIKAGTLGALPLHENPFADWSAHLFIADRTQYVILSNTKSLYSTVMYGKGITNDSHFIDRALSSIREFMEADGQEFAYRRLIARASTSVRFAKALDRSVTGSMKELILHATDWLTEGDLSPHDVGFKLNDILLSSLAERKPDLYRKPREAFKSLLSVPDDITLTTPEQAKQIWKIVQTWEGKAGTGVIHCEQGISRSPAVAAALCEGYGGDPDGLLHLQSTHERS